MIFITSVDILTNKTTILCLKSPSKHRDLLLKEWNAANPDVARMARDPFLVHGFLLRQLAKERYFFQCVLAGKLYTLVRILLPPPRPWPG